MKTLADPQAVLAHELAAVRTEFQVPAAFPPAVLAAADEAARRVPDAHVDRTAVPFVTLDPAASTDLDQAFAIEAAGADLLLHYAIADVAWFVADGDAVDQEAWRRGTTLYLPDGKAGLYPPVLSEGAASLLPDGPRPAVMFTVRVAPDGAVALEGAERAIVRSRAKLAYDTVRDADLPAGFAELAMRIQAAEDRRGAERVDPPEQSVEPDADGALRLRFRPRLLSEERNAALSLATNLAVAEALQAHHTGLFRVMAEPDAGAVLRLRHTAQAFGLAWPEAETLAQFQRSLDAAVPAQAAFMLAIRRAGAGAGGRTCRSARARCRGTRRWRRPMRTRPPLRRLADRYVVQAALAVCNGAAVPDAVTAAFATLPHVMARADALGGRIDRAVIDLAEAAMLDGRVGETFAAVVTDGDNRAARIQLRDMPVVARIAADAGGAPGDVVQARLTGVDVAKRTVTFENAA